MSDLTAYASAFNLTIILQETKGWATRALQGDTNNIDV